MTPAELVLLTREHNARHEPAEKGKQDRAAASAFDKVTRRAGG